MSTKKDYLEKIIAHKKKVNVSKQSFYQTIQKSLNSIEYCEYRIFKKSISVAGRMNVIAEIKKASPSKGLIRPNFNVKQIAKAYFDVPVNAISVLTEDKFFLGNMQYLQNVTQHEDCHVPVLAKDFFIEIGQIYEAQFNGASAVLLIMSILTNEEVETFIEVAHKLDLDCLVEVHNEEELKRALDCGADIIGINNRNLNTFDVDLKNSERLIKLIPKNVVIVAESGITCYEDICYLKEVGAHAVLIGETFMREKDIQQKVKDVMGYES